MKPILMVAAFTIFFGAPAFSQSESGHGAPNDQHGGQGPHGVLAAPAPLIGAGIPGLAIGIGYGIYWLASRRRKPMA